MPYIDKKINENYTVFLETEQNIKEKISELLKKIDLKNKEKIKKITNQNTVEESDNKDKIYIVSGTEKYIEDKNELIERYYVHKNINIKIINCYQVMDDIDMQKIISRNGYEKKVSTIGENKYFIIDYF